MDNRQKLREAQRLIGEVRDDEFVSAPVPSQLGAAVAAIEAALAFPVSEVEQHELS